LSLFSCFRLNSGLFRPPACRDFDIPVELHLHGSSDDWHPFPSCAQRQARQTPGLARSPADSRSRDPHRDRPLVESQFSGYATIFQNELDKHGNFAQVLTIPAKGNKQERLVEVLESTVNYKKVSFDPTIFEDKKTVDQFKNWTFKSLPEFDDRIDALAHLVLHFMETLKWGEARSWESYEEPEQAPW
jgi:hypothetical protein